MPRKRIPPKGNVALHTVSSQILNNERKVWAYTPPGYTRTRAKNDLLMLFDGATYAHEIAAPSIFDALITTRQLPPFVAVMIDSLDEATRERELACSEPFVAFLADELLPWARAHFRVTADPGCVTVGGASYGGLAAAFAALTRPGVFGRVLSQSGSFWWSPDGDAEPEWLGRRFVESPPLPIEFALSVGLREAKARITPHQVTVNRHMRNILRAKDYIVHYAEHDGAHDAESWRASLADGLLAFGKNEDIRQA